jgi:hypothetical protein
LSALLKIGIRQSAGAVSDRIPEEIASFSAIACSG